MKSELLVLAFRIKKMNKMTADMMMDLIGLAEENPAVLEMLKRWAADAEVKAPMPVRMAA